MESSFVTPFNNSNSASPKDDPSFKRSSSNSNENIADTSNDPVVLYISGLARDVDDQALLELFSKYGKVLRNDVVRDPHLKESRGFGFVTLSNSEEAESAIKALHSTDFHDRVLGVERAKRVRPRSPTPGQYRGPSRDGGRRDPRYGSSAPRHQTDSRYSRRERSPRRGGPPGTYVDRYEPQRGFEPYAAPTRAYSNYPPPPAGYYSRPPPPTQPGYYGAGGGYSGYPSNPPPQDPYSYGKYPAPHAYPPPPTGSTGAYPPAPPPNARPRTPPRY